MPSTANQKFALSLTTTAFTVCFAVWTIFAIIGVQIKQDMGLSDTQFSFERFRYFGSSSHFSGCTRIDVNRIVAPMGS